MLRWLKDKVSFFITAKGNHSFFIFLTFLFTALLTCVIYAFQILPASSSSFFSSSQNNTMRYNWTCVVSSGSFYSITLPAQLKNIQNNTLIASNTLPENIPVNAAVSFRSSQQAVKVYVDDLLIYKYDTSVGRLLGKSTPSHWNFISLSPEDAQKELRIELTSPYRIHSGQLGMVYYGRYSDLVTQLLRKTLPGLVTSIILFLIGIVIVFTSYILGRENGEAYHFRYLGYFICVLAVWMRSEVRLPDFLMGDPHLELLISYFALMLCPLPYLTFVKHRLHPRPYKVLQIFFSLYCLNFLICTLLQVLNIYDFVETAFIFHILAFANILWVCLQYIQQIIRKERTYRISSIVAFASLVAGVTLELLVYYTGYYQYTGLFFRIGISIYIIGLTVLAIQSIISQRLLNAQISEQLLKRQIRMMLSHIQPHFLFNSLGAIQSLIRKSPDTAYQMLFDFSKYLRASIGAWNSQDLIAFHSELENVKSFTNIQLIRFRNAFRVEYEIEASNFMVPILSIRALVENAVNHGARRSSSEDAFVLIHSFESQNYFIVEVIDNGPGFHVEEKLSNSDSTSGLHRCRHILETELNATIDIHSSLGKGTTVIVHIPKYRTHKS